MKNINDMSDASRNLYGTIKGSVQIQRNKYGNDDVLTLCCIKVNLFDADKQWVAEETTDDNGKFAFIGIPLKEYTVVFPELINYQNQSFLPQGSRFQNEFKIALSYEQMRVDKVNIHYTLPQISVIQGLPSNTDDQPVLGVNA